MYDIFNRRYTGSKYKLRGWIDGLVAEHCKGDSFFDVFAGTGVVSYTVLPRYQRVIMNDFLFSNEVIYKAFFMRGEYSRSLIEDYQRQFTALSPSAVCENYFSQSFGEKFFNADDAKVIGHIRKTLERDRGELAEKEFTILLASLLYSADRCANTVGHYDAYIKGKPIPSRFEYALVTPVTNCAEVEIHREDANELASEISADVSYIDPPYNSRQYSRFYHVLENLTKWEKPELYGTALKPVEENMSDYCRTAALERFADLIGKLNTGDTIVSYNNTYAGKTTIENRDNYYV
jgi:adenine-specific DNA-methyltransferase